MGVSERDPHSGHQTTGHEWNGIKELNTPVPWPVWFFLIATGLFAVVYWVLMPAWPLGRTYTQGLLGTDQRAIVTRQVTRANEDRASGTSRIAALDVKQIRADPTLMKAVRDDGHRLFGDNCAACHGSDAGGNKGFPNLIDGDWLWGGSPNQIAETIAVGINSPAATNSRASQMLAFGRDGILDNDAVIAVTDYVRSLTDPGVARGAGAKSVAAGRAVFAANCVACHGPDARGNQSLGAPDLADRTWLYGGDAQSVYTSIHDGRRGEMPAWGERLSAVDRKLLLVWLLDKGSAP
ncbi:cytochrome-c oxidase, cbb3-type subunit III [Novosphingobium sp.]|uniref:cytochrome-c oxidase, cbb3-type subunit III n=1 Tax=Novosphingobium sp. TaxID=1874826 RepID=UPI0025D46D8D|nr:cytochrome-c oxidase, cbb3-type subunit III [Novosphingobium sp.]MCC6926060.1 cytochrome-c oxidase, cbb3-type subunit III [Novosphingobium sp.]